jgi:hypothetical protein
MNTAKRSVGALLALALLAAGLVAVAITASGGAVYAMGGVGVLLIVGGGLFLFAGRRGKGAG